MATVKRSKEVLSFEAWCQRELSRLLKFPVDEELVVYLLTIEARKDVEEYLEELLGTKVHVWTRVNVLIFSLFDDVN